MSFSASIVELVDASNAGSVAIANWWERVALAGVVRLLNGFPFPSEQFNEHEGHPLLRIRDVTAGDTETYFRGSAEERYWVDPGDIVVGMDGDFNSRIWEGKRALLNQRVCKLTPDERFLDKQFLAHALPGYLRLINSETHSVTVKHLSSRTMQEIPLPLPPRPEQRRIVEKIESLFARSACARDELAHIPRLIERYRQAVLASAFRGDLTADWRGDETQHGERPCSWQMVSAGDLFDEGPTNGYSPKAAEDGGGTTSLKLSATTTGTFILNEKTIKRLVETVSPDARCWLRPGDILVQRANSLEHLAATAIFDGPANQYIYPDLMMRVRIASVVTRQFFWRYMQSDTARNWLRDRATGTAGNMPKISGAILKVLPVPVPPEDEQAEIVKRIEQRLTAIETVLGECRHAIAMTARLDQSILDKAFSGELVPQDPADEPASVLLARIKAARTQGQGLGHDALQKWGAILPLQTAAVVMHQTPAILHRQIIQHLAHSGHGFRRR